MFNAQQFAMNFLNANPNVANQPNAVDMVNAIRNNDAKAGEALANNILQSVGMTKEQALALAAQKFRF